MVEDALTKDVFFTSLLRNRRRFILALSTLAIITLGTIFLRWRWSSRSVLVTNAFDFANALLAALFGSAIVAYLVVRQQIHGIATEANEFLSMLGDYRDFESGVAIVLPQFFLSKDARDHRESTDVEALIGALRKGGEDVVINDIDPLIARLKNAVGANAYNRNDVLLAGDLQRLIGESHLEQPRIVSDTAFVRYAYEAARSKFDTTIRVPYDTSRSSTGAHPQRSRWSRSRSGSPVKTVVVIGLWSNLISWLLSAADNVPFSMLGDAQRQLKLTTNQGYGKSFHVNAEDGSDENKRPLALLARLRLSDLTIYLIGGISSLGTARIGDLITGNCDGGDASEKIRGISKDCTFWALMSCPERGERGGDYLTTDFSDPIVQKDRNQPARARPQPWTVSFLSLFTDAALQAALRRTDRTAVDIRDKDRQTGERADH